MLKKIYYNCYYIADVLRYYGITSALKHVLRFVLDLIVVLAVATLFMRFFIICGVSQTTSLIVGMVTGIVANVYIKFRWKLL